MTEQLRCSSTDGDYSAPEQATVRKMAAKLGIAEDVVKEIESICLEESQLQEKRLALMYPSGTPI
ncbi:MAG: hypothetical protein Tsb0014_31600 [Pleurocapsa sp.]